MSMCLHECVRVRVCPIYNIQNTNHKSNEIEIHMSQLIKDILLQALTNTVSASGVQNGAFITFTPIRTNNIYTGASNAGIFT